MLSSAEGGGLLRKTGTSSSVSRLAGSSKRNCCEHLGTLHAGSCIVRHH
jgi:hypothetical protein